MSWQVEYTSKAVRQLKKLPVSIKDTILALVMDIENTGPIRGDWPNFSKLGLINYHCHLKKGKPTYVACWRVLDKKNKIIEVYYVGTHEKAPY
ncbi:MAG: cytotoxic translational repressor of toxin-antitoxin stability system [Bdellovibrionales bacterium]|nr:cytotoxic translational repressor of toxin-antitoxin stability system [Bdellovibrionales bacterium]